MSNRCGSRTSIWGEGAQIYQNKSNTHFCVDKKISQGFFKFLFYFSIKIHWRGEGRPYCPLPPWIFTWWAKLYIVLILSNIIKVIRTKSVFFFFLCVISRWFEQSRQVLVETNKFFKNIIYNDILHRDWVINADKN